MMVQFVAKAAKLFPGVLCFHVFVFRQLNHKNTIISPGFAVFFR